MESIENPVFNKALLQLDSVVYTKSSVVEQYPGGDQQKLWWAIPQGFHWEIHSDDVIAVKQYFDPLVNPGAFKEKVNDVMPKYHALVSNGAIPVVWIHEDNLVSSMYVGKISVFSPDLATMAPIFAEWSWHQDGPKVGPKLHHWGTSVYEFDSKSIFVANGYYMLPK